MFQLLYHGKCKRGRVAPTIRNETKENGFSNTLFDRRNKTSNGRIRRSII